MIGDVLKTLEETDQLDNTLVFFLSDNGAWMNPSNGLGDDSVPAIDGGQNAPFKEGKGSTWEGGLRVPLIVKTPAAATSSTCNARPSIPTPTSSLDIFPTILSYAGLAAGNSKQLDGLSLEPLLSGTSDELDRECLYWWREASLYALRCGHLKAHLITRSGFDFQDVGTKHDPPLVFNIENDPGELYPLEVGKGVSDAELAYLGRMAAEHEELLEEDKAASLYLAQSISVMPCCKRGGGGDNDVPKVWKHCVCPRELAVTE